MGASSAGTSARSRSQARSGSRAKTGPTSKRPSTKKPERRYGNEVPRVYTPPLRELTPETSLGFAVISFASEMLLIELLPWQKWLLIHMLELLPDNRLRFRTVVVLVARQNGKSTLSVVLALWFMYCYGLGLILGTAQDLDTAEEVWQHAVDLVTEEDDDEEPVRPELHELVSDVVKVNGKKSLNIGGKGKGRAKSRYKVKAANRRAGRGLSGELVLLDELREHQSWDAWGSITKTTIAKKMALVLAMSNAGDATSLVLRHLRKLAHGKLGDPDGIVAADEQAESDAPTAEDLEEFDDEAQDLLEGLESEEDDSLGIFEWSAHPDRAVRDRAGWAEANPSLGYTIQESTLASACATDPEWVFRTECLCQWPGGTLRGPFPSMRWETGLWDKHADPPKIIGKVRACISMSHDRTRASIAYAGYRDDGIVQVEIVAQRAGSDWVKEWFAEPRRRDRVEVIVGLKGGPEGELLKELKADELPVFEWSGDNVPGWTGEFYDLVCATATDDAGDLVDGLSHGPSPALDVAAGNAVTRPIGKRFEWDLVKSSVDVHTLIAATGAVGHLLTQREKAPPPSPRRVRSARASSGSAATAGF